MVAWELDGADPQVREVARRFALVAVAGELARALGVLPWPEGEATAAARAVFGWWLDARGGTAAGEAMAVPAHLRRFLTAHGSSRFQPVEWQHAASAWELRHDPHRPVLNRVGWRYRKDGADLEFVIPPEAWGEVFAGLNSTEAARVLAEAKHIRTDGRHRTVKRRPPGEATQRRMFVVDVASLYADAPDDAPPAADTAEEEL